MTSLRQLLSTKFCANILRHSTQFTSYPHTLADLINGGLRSQASANLNATIEILDILVLRNWLHLIGDQLDKDMLLQRLEPKRSAQHSRLILALGMTENQQIWSHSFKCFIRSQWLSLIQHPIQLNTIEERHSMGRLITKFLSFGGNRLDESDNRWESLPLLWMLITQPQLIKQIIDPFTLNLLLNEQFHNITHNQQTEFIQRLLMLVSNLDTLIVLRRHFQLINKLPQV